MTDENDGADDSADVDELKAQFGGASAGGDRLDNVREESASGRDELKEAMLAALAEIDAGDRQKTVSLWDGNLAALFAGLEANDEARRDVARAFADDLEAQEQGTVPSDVDPDAPDRSDVLRLALLHALNDAAPEYLDILREALQERASTTI
jgi:hypothetical protein